MENGATPMGPERYFIEHEDPFDENFSSIFKTKRTSIREFYLFLDLRNRRIAAKIKKGILRIGVLFEDDILLWA